MDLPASALAVGADVTLSQRIPSGKVGHPHQASLGRDQRVEGSQQQIICSDARRGGGAKGNRRRRVALQLILH